MKKKIKQEKEDKRTMAVIDTNNTKDKATTEAKLHKNKEVEVTDIAQDWVIKEFTLRLLSGAMDNYMTEVKFVASSGEEILADAEVTCTCIKLPKYLKERIQGPAILSRSPPFRMS